MISPRFINVIKGKLISGKMLDVGCGGGYICKALKEKGYDIYGVEPSHKLRKFCRENLKLEKIVGEIEELDMKFDVISIFDVIEHLNPFITRRVMKSIILRLEKDGFLIGQTPNFNSANIRLYGDRAPVISPPSHACYFTIGTLEKYLQSFGLKKVKADTTGLSSNSFFRKVKFEHSYLENSLSRIKFYQVPTWIFFKGLFRLLGLSIGPFRLGYEIRFIYQW